MKNQIRGCVKINASGKNLYKFINMIHCGHISCFGQYCKKDVFYAEIYRHDLPKLEKMAEECGVELKSFEYNTVSSIIIRHRKRFGIAIGIIIAIAASLYFSSVVVTIEIQGNTSVSESAILSALSELNIKQGTPIRDIDFHYCENKLRLMVDDISWAGIRHTGNRVVVEITEIVPPPEMLRERVPCNIVASKDAEITYTSIYDGQLMHKIGDFVPQGTLLVSGVTSDDTGHVTIHHAMGKITGIYEETVVFEEEYTVRRLNPTGNEHNEKYLKLFNLNIPLFFGKNDYQNFNAEENEKKLRIFGKNLPIGIISKKIAETELSETTFTDEELSEKIEEKIYLYEKNFLTDDVTILDRKTVTEKTEDTLKYTVTFRIEGEIGIQKDIFIK